MQDETNTGHEQDYHCGHHCHGWGHRHFFLRWLLGLLILAIVFWLGVKVGEFRGAFGGGWYGGYGRMHGGWMMGSPDYYDGYYNYPPMMRWPNNASSTPAR